MTSQTELLTKAQTDKRTQPLIIDFYNNLHLEAGPQYDKSKTSPPFAINSIGCTYREEPPYENEEDVKLIYPDDNEQNRITEFIEENVPNLGEEFRQYQERTGENWFVSKHFMRFAYDYEFSMNLIDGYTDRRVPSAALSWLGARLADYSYKLGLILISKKDGDIYHTRPFLDAPIDDGFCYVDDYEFDVELKGLTSTGPDQMPHYGIPLDSLWDRIINELVEMLRGKWGITKCQADDCNNILLQEELGRQRLYCSNTCRYRVNQRKWRQKQT